MIEVDCNWAWHSTAMLGCNAECPKCQHHFVCCPPAPCCVAVNVRHSFGGTLNLHHHQQQHQPQPQPQQHQHQQQQHQPDPAPHQHHHHHHQQQQPPHHHNSNRASLSPQPSPGLSLEFVIPPPVPHQRGTSSSATPQPPRPHKTLPERIQALYRSGWYYGAITYQQSEQLLINRPVGTFIVRDSSDPRFMYSLSVQTAKGPTSIRLHFADGCFKLDSQPHLMAAMPRFNSVQELIEYYVRWSRSENQVWVDPAGKWHSAIVIERPLRKGDAPPSLKHLARLAVHGALQGGKNRANRDPVAYKKLDLPRSLVNYLDEYPYSI